MDPTYVRDEPGKDYMNMDLVPVYEEAPAPRCSISSRARGFAKRAQGQVLGVAHGPRLCQGQAR